MKATYIAAIVGFAASIVGLIQAFSFNHIETVTCHYTSQQDEQSTVLECLRGLNANAGDVVMLDWQTYVGEIREPGWDEPYRLPFERRVSPDWVRWQFGASQFCEQLGVSEQNCSGDDNFHGRVVPMLNERFSQNDTTWYDAGVLNNGLSVTISLGIRGANPFSTVGQIEEYDVAQGPFQISFENSDNAGRLWLTPAPMTDALAQQVRCARRDWPGIIRFVVCPFA